MKKKQLTSILLAGIMILGLCAPAFADEGTGGQSTNVEYTALNNESYLLIVPANMTPGETGNVSLTGSWPSTRTMKVTVDSNVVLTNSINATDKKTLTISFNEIALAGNNNETVSATGEVSVQDITNANFGEWTGRFSYYVNGEGTGANDPVISLAPTMAARGDWYKSTQEKETITSIKFVDSYTPTGSEDETWYADKDNGAVPETQITAYRTGTEIVVAGNGSGKIMANENSRLMFAGFYALTSLDLSNFDTSAVTDMGWMFRECYALTSLDVSSFNTSKVTAMGYMFYGCSKLTSLDLSNFNTSKVIYMGEMFNGCNRLVSIYVGSRWNTNAVIDSDGMFYNCTKLPNYDSSVVDKTNAHTGSGGYLISKT